MSAASPPAGPPAASGPSAPPGPAAASAGWTAGRVIALAAGSVLVLVSLVLLGGGVLTWADREQQGGYLNTGTATYSTGGYALASNPISLHDGWGWLGRFAGEIRFRVTAASPAEPVFVAIGPAGDVSRYLAGVSYISAAAFGDHDVTQHLGSAAPAPPRPPPLAG